MVLGPQAYAPPTPPPALGPMSLMEILDASFRMYRQNFLLFLGIMSIPYIPFLLASMAMYAGLVNMNPEAAKQRPFKINLINVQPPAPAPPVQGVEPPTPSVGAILATCGGSVLVLLMAFIAIPIAKGALTRAVSDRYLGLPVTVGSSYRAIFSIFFMYLLTVLLANLLVGLGYMMIACPIAGAVALIAAGQVVAGTIAAVVLIVPSLIPGFLLYALFASFVSQIMVVEGTTGTAAMGRNMALGKDHRRRIVSLLVIQILVGALLAFALSLTLQFLISRIIESQQLVFVLQQGTGQLIGMLLEPLWSVAWILLYFDVRIRKEGLDLQIMARRLTPPLPREKLA